MSEFDETVVSTEVEDATATESAPVEQEQSENTDQLFEKMFGDDDPSNEVEEEAEPKAEEPKEETTEDEAVDDKPKRGAEARKEQLSSEKEAINEEIRNLVAERNAALAEKAQIEQEMAQAQKQNELPTVEGLLNTVNELTGEYYTEFEAQAIVENLTLRQKIEDIEQNQKQAEIQRQINSSVKNLADEVNRALKDFPEFDSQSDRYNKNLSEKATAIVKDVLVRNPQNNDVIGSYISIYDLYATLSTAGKTSNRAGNVNYSQQAKADILGGGSGVAFGKDEATKFVNNFFED